MVRSPVILVTPMMTIKQVQECDFISAVVENYRATHDFLTSPCWMDEWTMGYFCALRDIGTINQEQWEFLNLAFQQVPDGEHA